MKYISVGDNSFRCLYTMVVAELDRVMVKCICEECDVCIVQVSAETIT